MQAGRAFRAFRDPEHHMPPAYFINQIEAGNVPSGTAETLVRCLEIALSQAADSLLALDCRARAFAGGEEIIKLLGIVLAAPYGERIDLAGPEPEPEPLQPGIYVNEGGRWYRLPWNGDPEGPWKGPGG
jgi:hypothetical protein